MHLLCFMSHTQEGRESSEKQFRVWFGDEYEVTPTQRNTVTPQLSVGVSVLRFQETPAGDR